MVPAKCGIIIVIIITVVATRLLLRAHATETTPRRQLGHTAGHPGLEDDPREMIHNESYTHFNLTRQFPRT